MARPGAAGGEFYWELEVELAPEAEEIWSLFCYDRGAAGAEVLREAPQHLTMRYFFPAGQPQPVEVWQAQFRAAHPGLPAPQRLSLRRKAVENWREAWRAHFRPTPVGRRLLVCPPWAAPGKKYAGKGRLPLIIEPGQGFGTGNHPSTALALELLEAHLEAAPRAGAVLDVGAGSGILAIGAALLGAGPAWALEIEGPALAEMRRNFRLNGLAPPRLVQGRPDCLRGGFPLVLANLTTPILLDYADELAGLTAPGGGLVLSGILEDEQPRIEASYRERGCAPAASASREGWWAGRFLR